MTTEQDAPLAHMLTTAEHVLSQYWQTTVRLAEPHNLQASGRSYIYRCTLLDAPADAPERVIIKAMRVWEHLKHEEETRSLIYNDWAGLQFLSDITPEPGFTPRFYAGDTNSALMVMEDLGTHPGMHDLLLGDDSHVAADALIRYSTMLGRIHAISIGKHERYEHLRTGLGTSIHYDHWDDQNLLAVLKELDIAPVSGLEQELAQLDAIIREPGPFLAYTHGDPCPDNVLVTQEIRLCDFEFGAYRHALVEGVYGRIHFPTCWCVNRLPAAIIQQMEQAYRAELIQGYPEAKDDKLFAQAVTIGCLYWTVGDCSKRLERMMQEDWQPNGRASGRQRLLARFAIAAQTTAEYSYMEAIGETLTALAAKLQALWPPEAQHMEYYPAFGLSVRS